MIPMRELTTDQLMNLKDTDEIRPIGLEDFRASLKSNQPSVSKATLDEFD